MRVVNTSFVANAAANEGVAILSVGVLDELSNVVFSKNSFLCRLGEYSFDIKNEVITVRATLKVSDDFHNTTQYKYPLKF